MGANILWHPLSSFFLMQTLLCVLLLGLPCNTTLDTNRLSNRQTLQIGIGIGIGGGSSPPSQPGPSPEPEPEPEPICQPTPPPPCPPPPSKKSPPPLHPTQPPRNPPQQPSPPRTLTPGDFPNLLLYKSYIVIQRFKKTIYRDPMHITKTWKGSDLSKYRGFFLDTPPRYQKTTLAVASIDFNGFHLGAPTLAGFIDGHPDLALFHANSNFFAGTLPNLTQLPYLSELDLSNNKFAGEFPSAVLPLAKITFLDLRYNLFAGIVPPAIFLVKLEVLFLNNNLFTQPLPANVGFSGAAYLTLANNGFTGSIPSSIGDAASTLIEVLFLGNRLSGCLPAEIGQLQKATVFDAGYNEITGPIPRTLGCLKRVEQLNFAGNLLYGKVPDEVCNLGSSGGGRLLNLSLSDNYFTSLGDSCLSLLQCGILDIRRNCISGYAEQRSPAECARFLARRKYCPSLSNVPRCNGGESSGYGGSSASGGSDPVRGSGFTSYSSMGKNGLGCN